MSLGSGGGRPDRAEFARLAAGADVVPVVRTLRADMLTPVLAFHRLRAPDGAFLFESVEGGERVGRYSFLGRKPYLRVSADEEGLRVAGPDAGRHLSEGGSPAERLRSLFASYRCARLPGLPPFTSGAVGVFGYDTVRWVERLPDLGRPHNPEPDLALFFPEEVVVFDHAFQQLHLIVNARPWAGEPAEATHARAMESLDLLEAALRRPLDPPSEPAPMEGVAPRSGIEREEFRRRVLEAKEHIAAGDIFQVVLSRRMTVPARVDDFSLYRELRALNPSPYMFLLRFDGWSAVGSSPEPLLRVQEGRLTYRPIAGTAPRSDDRDEDERRAAALLADPKERAEHVMLVDLGRNDLGRVAVAGSVRVDELMSVERYSHVMHLVSGLSATLRPDVSPLDALFACFPAGTVSGAPKVRAMEIIEELEPERRGVYAGAVGYLDFRENLDTCIALRTMVVRANEVMVQAGAGIVADSDPDREFDETGHKARALLEAIERAGARSV